MAGNDTNTDTELSTWDKFKRDLVERFLNFETAKGVYMIPAGVVGLYVTWFHIQYVIQAAGSIMFWYMISEGLRKVMVNRIKQEVATKQLVAARLETIGAVETITRSEALDVSKVIPTPEASSTSGN